MSLQPPTATSAMLNDPYICALCGYSTMKHIVTDYANSPTGLYCPTDTRVADQYRLPALSANGRADRG